MPNHVFTLIENELELAKPVAGAFQQTVRSDDPKVDFPATKNLDGEGCRRVGAIFFVLGSATLELGATNFKPLDSGDSAPSTSFADPAFSMNRAPPFGGPGVRNLGFGQDQHIG